MTVLMFFGSMIAAPAASAAPTSVTISNPSFSVTSAGVNDRFSFNFDWAVPDSAVAGDSFTVTLPPQINTRNTQAFDLTVPNGTAVIAQGTWSGNTATITLTDYVTDKKDRKGKAEFWLEWNKQLMQDQPSSDLQLSFSGSYPFILPLSYEGLGDEDNSRGNDKVGRWHVVPGEGPETQIEWTVALAQGNYLDPTGPNVTVLDTPDEWSVIDIESVEARVMVNGSVEELSTERYQVFRHGDRGIRIELHGHTESHPAINDGEAISFVYVSRLLPGAEKVKSFTNKADITGFSRGSASASVNSEVFRDGASGDGDGDNDTKVTPVKPVVTQAVCDTTTGNTSAPVITFADTTGITYTGGNNAKAGDTVTITATAATGYALDTADGWTPKDDGTATFTITLDEVDCEKAPTKVTPKDPAVTPAVCDTTTGNTTPAVITYETTDGITYTGGENVKAGDTTVTITATTTDDKVIAVDPDGDWKLQDDGTATLTIELEVPECEKVTPPTEVEPVKPVVTQAVCDSTTGSTSAPVITFADTTGITYTGGNNAKAGDTVTITATADGGNVLTVADGSGWKLQENGTATFEISLEQANCTKDPEITPPVNKPGASKPVPPTPQHPLAATGLTSAPLFMGGAALLVLAGLLIAGARRKA